MHAVISLTILIKLMIFHTVPMAPEVAISTQDESMAVTRQSANYHPTIWGNYFLRYTADADNYEAESAADNQKIVELVLKVNKMLVIDEHNPIQTLKLIDQIQRLGIAYKFANEIGEALEQIKKIYFENGGGIIDETEDLFTIALLFRLLRQQGCRISCDIFNRFKDDKGTFKEFIITDIQGMLSLYEASHFRIRGEDILEEALSFTTTHLASMKSRADPHTEKQVEHALNLSLRHGLTRLGAIQYMTSYESNTNHEETLLTLAKLDFNLLQKQHQKEVSEITRWWKELDFQRKLPFIRDRIVESYVWALGVYFEPEYSLARKIFTKMVVMLTTIDDIYDVYGTMEELELFTNSVERWSIETMCDLPEYMQWCYKALLDFYDEIEETSAQQEKSYRLQHAKQTMKDIVRAYLSEAQSLQQVAAMEDYMSIASKTANGMLAVACFLGMGDVVTQDVFEWLSTNPKMLKATNIIARLMDDIGSRKHEKERDHIATAVDCYMKQHMVTEEEAIKELRKQIADSWKDINEECLHPTAFPMTILTRILNITCILSILYSDGEDHYTNSGTKMRSYVKSLLIEPIPV